MLTLITKFYALERACTTVFSTQIFRRNYVQSTLDRKLGKIIHPYKQIHPWNSRTEFSEDLLNSIIYNKDGLVVLNKPYGIRCKKQINTVKNKYNNIPYGVDYVLEDALPYIAKQLNYSKLTISRAPEMYMSGITLLSANENVDNAIELAFIQSHFFSKTYWVVVVGLPNELKGKHRLAMKLISHEEYKIRKAVIISSWSINDEKQRRIKLLKAEYQVLSSSTHNLCSLIQIKSSTNKNHAVRLFASTFLYCPVLGDNVCSLQIQKVGDTFLKVDPFLPNLKQPKLDRRLLQILELSNSEQNIIPIHIHLRSIELPIFFENALTIEAPLPPSFDWTCKQLELKTSLRNNVSRK